MAAKNFALAAASYANLFSRRESKNTFWPGFTATVAHGIGALDEVTQQLPAVLPVLCALTIPHFARKLHF
jgi:hypothetical protein